MILFQLDFLHKKKVAVKCAGAPPSYLGAEAERGIPAQSGYAVLCEVL
jgi:hypothetical protein